MVSLTLTVPINAFVFRKFVKPNTAELFIENRSNLLIESIDVRLCDTTKRITRLENGQKTSMKFDNLGECHYLISVKFEEGKSLASEVGYITSGSDVTDSVIVEDSQILQEKPIIVPDPNYFANIAALFLSYVIIVLLVYQGLIFFLRKIMK